MDCVDYLGNHCNNLGDQQRWQAKDGAGSGGGEEYEIREERKKNRVKKYKKKT